MAKFDFISSLTTQQAGVATTPTLLKAPRTPPHTTMMSVSSQWEQLCHEAEAAVVRKLREQVWSQNFVCLVVLS